MALFQQTTSSQERLPRNSAQEFRAALILRDAYLRAKLEIIKLKPGDVIADIGAGSGYESVAFSNEVTMSGRVFHEDIGARSNQIFELSRLEQTNKRHPAFSNAKAITIVTGTPTDPKLPQNSLDYASINLSHHEFSNPLAMDKAILKSLKIGGKIFVFENWNEVEFENATDEKMRGAHVSNPAVVKKALIDAGFSSVETRKLFYFLGTNNKGYYYVTIGVRDK